MDIIKNIINMYIQNPKLFIEPIIFLTLCVLIKKFYSTFRGFMGEFWVKLELKKIQKKGYIIINDVMLRDNNGTHQIDHIVLSNYKIFVIEMKNYYGLITGRELDEKWCQHFGKKRFYFQNPIHQNYGHIKCLSELLNIKEKNFISIVCFANQAKLRISSKSIVTQIDLLVSQILRYSDVDDDLNIEKYYQTIRLSNITNKTERKNHVKNIKERITNDKFLESNMICPKCGNLLLEKDGKYGKFIGCSNYPKCNYIRKINKG